jgi:hypothetical protein
MIQYCTQEEARRKDLLAQKSKAISTEMAKARKKRTA